MNAEVELVAERLLHLARPGGVVLVDRQFFGPLVEVLRERADHLKLSIRTAHFEDPVSLLKQALMTPKPAIACCPDAVIGEKCDCLQKAHMLLEQMGIPVIETHATLVTMVTATPPEPRCPEPSTPSRVSVAA